MIRTGINTSITVLHGITENPLTRPLFDRYFRHLYYACDLDRHQIRAELKMDGKLDRELSVNFRTVAGKFRLIRDEDSIPVIVLYRGEGSEIDQWFATLRKDGPQRWLMRKLQRYTVNIHQRDAERLRGQGDIEEILPGLFVQNSDWLYDEKVGLLPEGSPLNPMGFIA